MSKNDDREAAFEAYKRDYGYSNPSVSTQLSFNAGYDAAKAESEGMAARRLPAYGHGFVGEYEDTIPQFTLKNMRESWEAARYHYRGAMQPLNFTEFIRAAYEAIKTEVHNETK